MVAPAVLEAWNQGSQDGRIVADLLFGVVNAGKPERYPGTDKGAGYPMIRYSEWLDIGYRWFQAQGVKPLFGFGLASPTPRSISPTCQ